MLFHVAAMCKFRGLSVPLRWLVFVVLQITCFTYHVDGVLCTKTANSFLVSPIGKSGGSYVGSLQVSNASRVLSSDLIVRFRKIFFEARRTRFNVSKDLLPGISLHLACAKVKNQSAATSSNRQRRYWEDGLNRAMMLGFKGYPWYQYSRTEGKKEFTNGTVASWIGRMAQHPWWRIGSHEW